MVHNKRQLKVMIRKKGGLDECGYIEVESSVFCSGQFNLKIAEKAVKDKYGPKYDFISILKEGEQMLHHGKGHRPKPRGVRRGRMDKWPAPEN